MPRPEFVEWEIKERSRLIGYIFGILDTRRCDALALKAFDDGIQFISPWGGEICTLRFELKDMPDPPPDWAKPYV